MNLEDVTMKDQRENEDQLRQLNEEFERKVRIGCRLRETMLCKERKSGIIIRCDYCNRESIPLFALALTLTSTLTLAANPI